MTPFYLSTDIIADANVSDLSTAESYLDDFVVGQRFCVDSQFAGSTVADMYSSASATLGSNSITVAGTVINNIGGPIVFGWLSVYLIQGDVDLDWSVTYGGDGTDPYYEARFSLYNALNRNLSGGVLVAEQTATDGPSSTITLSVPSSGEYWIYASCEGTSDDEVNSGGSCSMSISASFLHSYLVGARYSDGSNTLRVYA